MVGCIILTHLVKHHIVSTAERATSSLEHFADGINLEYPTAKRMNNSLRWKKSHTDLLANLLVNDDIH